jgi:hypothetical protein
VDARTVSYSSRRVSPRRCELTEAVRRSHLNESSPRTRSHRDQIGLQTMLKALREAQVAVIA